MLAFDDFDKLVGAEVSALSPVHGAVPLTITEATAHDANRFTVLFSGPDSLPLEQATYSLTLGDAGDHLVFMVPVGAAEGAYTYEAVFQTAP